MSLLSKILLSIVIVFGLAICFISPIKERLYQFSQYEKLDRLTEGYLNDTLKKTSISFVASRGVNSLVSVAQSIETGGSLKLFGSGGSVNISFGQVLDPLNDMVERFSWLMLLSSISIGIQIFFQKALPWVCSQILFPIFLLCLLSTLWLPIKKKSYLIKVSLKIFLTTLIIRLILPTMASTNQAMYELFLEKEYQASTTFIENQDVQFSEDINISPFDRVKDLKDKIQLLIKKSRNFFDNLIKLMIVFIIQTIILPLITLWLIIYLIKFILNRTTNFEIEHIFSDKILGKHP